MNLAIRPATAADVGLLADLSERTFRGAFGDQNTPENVAAHVGQHYSEDRLAKELGDPDVLFLIAEIDGGAVGYSKLQAGPPPACVRGDRPIELARLYVDQKLVGRAVGSALMEACLREAQNRGHRTMWLGVWEHNPRAYAFYRKWDFRRVGEHVFEVGADPQIDWLMERAL